MITADTSKDTFLDEFMQIPQEELPAFNVAMRLFLDKDPEMASLIDARDYGAIRAYACRVYEAQQGGRSHE